ncbi:hypothetical protein HMPREF9505_01990, partial [Enterococcus faecalis TX0109]
FFFFKKKKKKFLKKKKNPPLSRHATCVLSVRFVYMLHCKQFLGNRQAENN